MTEAEVAISLMPEHHEFDAALRRASESHSKAREQSHEG
jgi:hypothetical protein